MAKILKTLNDGDSVTKIPPKNPEPEQKNVPVEPVSIESAQPKTLQDWIDKREKIRAELKEFIGNRKAVMKWDEAREYRKKTWEIRSRIGICDQKIIELKRAQKRTESAKKPTLVGLRQARFLGLLKQGISISNITRKSDGVPKDALESIMTQEFIEDCEKQQPGFSQRWQRWKEKFLNK